MTFQRGRDLLLKAGDGADPETYSTLGAARLVEMNVQNQAVAATAMNGGGFGAVEAAAGLQGLEIRLEGLFRDAAAEETLRAAAFGRTARNYRLQFPNGDIYEAAFVIAHYQRGGAVDGLESFAVTLLRTGGGTFT